jgi:NodT family efflux transporter outer membrane factor (OMF) lipoprotein
MPQGLESNTALSVSATGASPVIRGRVLFLYPVLLVLPLLAQYGCAVGPDFVRPEPPSATQYTQGGEPSETVAAAAQTQHFESAASVAADWWRLFGSAQLDAVIQEAMAGNQNVQVAQARLRESQANLTAAFGVLLPQADANFDAARQKFSLVRFGGASSSTFNLYTATATVSYAVDVFGGARRAVESQSAQVDFQQYEVQATNLTLLGNVVNTIVAQAAYRAQIAATEQIIVSTRDQLQITEAQAQAGIVPYVNVLSIQTQLSAFEASLPPLRQNLNQSQHLLATMVGRTPAEWTPPLIDLADLNLPGELPVSLPSDLVHQRPDILAAEAQLHSASANIGVATAALFPSLTLNAAYGQNNTSIVNLFDKAGGFWSLGAGLAAPLLHGGTLWFERQAAIEAFQAALAIYRQTVLSAFAQVADVLRALQHDAQTLAALAQAVDSAAQALQLLEVNYQAGTANYVQILIANIQYHQATISYLQAQAQRLQDTTALFVALGGGWWNGPEKTGLARTNGEKPS